MSGRRAKVNRVHRERAEVLQFARQVVADPDGYDSGLVDAMRRAVDQLDTAAVYLERDDSLRLLAGVGRLRRELEIRESKLVEVARSHGASWNVIARSVGLTAEGARKRWSQ